MTISDVTKILARIAVAWPNSEFAKSDKRTMTLTAQVWAENTADIEYWAGVLGINALCKTSKFSPSIAEFREASKHEYEKVQSKRLFWWTIFCSDGDDAFVDLFSTLAKEEMPLLQQSKDFHEYWGFCLKQLRNKAAGGESAHLGQHQREGLPG